MKKDFKCPLCNRKSLMSNKNQHASWTCPNCHHSVVPSKEIANNGQMPTTYINKIYKMRKNYREDHKRTV